MMYWCGLSPTTVTSQLKITGDLRGNALGAINYDASVDTSLRNKEKETDPLTLDVTLRHSPILLAAGSSEIPEAYKSEVFIF